MNDDIVYKIITREFRIKNNVYNYKFGAIYNFQTNIYIFIDHYKYSLGIEEYFKDFIVGVVVLFDGLDHLL